VANDPSSKGTFSVRLHQPPAPVLLALTLLFAPGCRNAEPPATVAPQPASAEEPDPSAAEPDASPGAEHASAPPTDGHQPGPAHEPAAGDADHFTDASWLGGALQREDAREQLVERLLRDSGYQGEPSVRNALLRDVNARLAKNPGDAATLIIHAMLTLPTDTLTDDNGYFVAETQAAIAGLEAAVEIDPRRVGAIIQLAKLYDTLPPEKAVAMWEKAVKHRPHDLEIRNHLGEAYTRSAQFEEAMVLSLKSIELAEAQGTEAHMRKARNIVGTSLSELGRYEEAEKYLKLALVNRDGSHWNCAYQALGILYSKVGKAHDNPLDPFEPPQPDPEDATANFSAALRFYYAHHPEDALTFIDRAIALQPTPHFLVVKGFMVMARKDYQSAGALFEQAAAAAGDDPGPAIGRGHLAIIEQDYEQAQLLLEPALGQWLRTSVATAPDPDYYHFMHRMGCLGMGWLHANQDQHDQAIKYFDRVLAHRPYDLLARLGKGNSLMGLQLMDQAEQELQGVLDLDPDNPYAKAELASIHLSRGDVAQAEQGFEAALAAHGKGYTCPYEGLGMVYLKQGKIEKARESFEKAISINPDIEYKKFNGLARIYIQEGRKAEARKLLRKSIANYPYDDEAKSLLDELDK
jgi:tetratricopeptide (TPR) repeat protein